MLVASGTLSFGGDEFPEKIRAVLVLQFDDFESYLY